MSILCTKDTFCSLLKTLYVCRKSLDTVSVSESPTQILCIGNSLGYKLILILILQQADNFTNSLGILQQSATPTPFQGISTSNKSKSDTATGKNNTDAAEKNANNTVNGNAATTANSAVNGASQLQKQERECAERFYYYMRSQDSKTVTCT